MESGYEQNPLIDLTYLKSICDNDAAFIREMIDMFINRAAQDMPVLLAAAEREEWEEVRKIVHKMKPSISFMGINSLKDTVQNCELLAIKREDPNMIKVLVDKLYNVLLQAVEELKQIKHPV